MIDREQVQSMRRAARARNIEALREGRKLRPVTIPSGKVYKRHNKHKGES